MYGVDSTSDHDDEFEDEGSVVVPDVLIPLSSGSIHRLHAINPLENSNDFGKQIYIDTVHLLL